MLLIVASRMSVAVTVLFLISLPVIKPAAVADPAIAMTIATTATAIAADGR